MFAYRISGTSEYLVVMSNVHYWADGVHSAQLLFGFIHFT